MPNVKLTLEYDGAAFHGWQSQPGVKTIQTELEKHLRILLRDESIVVNASGRTDAGVHAKGQIATFKVTAAIDSSILERVKASINGLMRGELAILKAETVPDGFHARHSAKVKQYRYTIYYSPVPPVLDRTRVWHIGSQLDVDRMTAEAASLVGQFDFTSFRASGCGSKSPIKTILRSELIHNPPFLVYEVEGQSFLKYMVRSIVGTLVEIGQGKLNLSFHQIIDLKDRTKAGMTAPAQGLCLEWVRY